MIKLSKSLRKLLSTEGELSTYSPAMPVFITGCMRSGTTLLVDKLTSHPQLLKIGDELNKVWTEMGGAGCLDVCDYKNDQEENTGEYTFNMSHYFFRFIQESMGIKRHAMRAKTLTERKLGRVTYNWKKIIPVNKSTHLVNKLLYVNRLFPHSKFIFIIRDIYAQSSSLKYHFLQGHKRSGLYKYMPREEKMCWGVLNQHQLQDLKAFPPHFEIIPQMWIRLNRLALEEIEKIDKDRFLVVSYEDLILKQEEIFLKIFEFLNLDRQYKKKEAKIAKRNIAFKNTSTKGNPLNKWQEQLTAEEISTIDEVIKKDQDNYSFIISQKEKLKISL